MAALLKVQFTFFMFAHLSQVIVCVPFHCTWNTLYLHLRALKNVTPKQMKSLFLLSLPVIFLGGRCHIMLLSVLYL
jgi:prolipoprotein diacylglyceryltransferase